jgi:hypothetical protein
MSLTQIGKIFAIRDTPRRRYYNDSGYSPENCKWSTQVEQRRNTRINKFLTIDGVTKTMIEWSESDGAAKYFTIKNRSKKSGWSDKEIVFGKRYHKKGDQI